MSALASSVATGDVLSRDGNLVDACENEDMDCDCGKAGTPGREASREGLNAREPARRGTEGGATVLGVVVSFRETVGVP